MMDNLFQDIHLVDSKTKKENVIRCVRIENISFLNKEWIHIRFKPADEEQTKIVMLPYLPGYKLIID